VTSTAAVITDSGLPIVAVTPSVLTPAAAGLLGVRGGPLHVVAVHRVLVNARVPASAAARMPRCTWMSGWL
jgi:hypothetical protein